MNVGTIIARNYLARARVMARSLRACDPASTVTALVVDGSYHADADDGFDVVTPEDIGVDTWELHRRAAGYDVNELCTSLKPRLLQHLLRSQPTAVYLDPDTYVFSSLAEAEQLAASHTIVLTPHRSAPVAPGSYPDDADLLRVGAYNLGFIAVSRDAAAFLDWWDARLASNCVADSSEGLFLDQKWLDLATAYFPFTAISDPGWNVSWWNTDTRRLEQQGPNVLVDGSPLRFFHFSGFDARSESLYGREPAKTRGRAPVDDTTKSLADRYRRDLDAAGHDEACATPYGFANAADGRPLTPAIRRAFRASEAEGVIPPDPFSPASVAGFETWAAPIRRAERIQATARRVARRRRSAPLVRRLERLARSLGYRWS